MRLLNVHKLEFNDYHFQPDKIPRYAIAPHRWDWKTEASLDQIQARRDTHKAGYQKVVDLAHYVEHNCPNIDWVWIDTCCIDHRYSQEVSTAINSMFKWYARAEVCLAYLGDIGSTDPGELYSSEWWTRGWTLQELLAPPVVVFLSRDWDVIGHKGSGKHCQNFDLGPRLDSLITSFTGIPENVLRDYDESQKLPTEVKLAWAAERKTTREEDLSYCLLGLLDVAMVVNYGEGGERARRRLLREVSEANIQPSFPACAGLASSSSERDTNPAETLSGCRTNQNLHQQVLKSLYFPQLEARREQIDTTYHGTYQWALLPESTTETQWDNLELWLGKPYSFGLVYWIYAKPGVGKSSFMRFLEDNLDQNRHMRPWSEGLDVTVVSYYFWNPGNALQKTLTGLLRTILYQLSVRNPRVLDLCTPSVRNSLAHTLKTPVVWTNSELRQYLRKVLPAVLSTSKLLFLIDGLDEIDGTDDDCDGLIEFLKELARNPNIKLCVSSRGWPMFHDAFSTCPQLRLEDLNGKDIRLYIQGQFESQERFCQMLTHNSGVKKLIEDIITKAKGVFLWVRLVVKELLRAIREGEGLDVLHQKICNIPGDLNAYFRQIFDSIDPNHRSEASALLQIALHEETGWIQLSSLRLLDLIFISHGNLDFACTTHLDHYVSELSTTDKLIYALDSALRMLSSRSKGLLECHFYHHSAFGNGPDEVDGAVIPRLPTSVRSALDRNKDTVFDLRVEFMHRSLRDYLLVPENQRVLHQHTGGPFDARNYLRNARVCQIFMCRNWRLNTETAVGLGSYVICTLSSPRFCKTARCTALLTRFSPALGYLLSNANRIPTYWYISGVFHSWNDEQSDLCTLAIDFNWTEYLKSTLTAEMIRAKRGRPMLDYVLRPRFYGEGAHFPGAGSDTFVIGNQFPAPDLVEHMLSLGANPNEIYIGIPVWIHFLSFLAHTSRLFERSETVTSACIASISHMIRGGASLYTDQRELSGPGGVVSVADNSFSTNWPQLVGSTRRTRSDSGVILITEVLKCLRFSLGGAVDHLKELAENERRDNYGRG